MSARLALYWAPEREDPLHAAASAWLGRDAETGAALPQPSIAGLDLAEVTADARGYGFHATLKAPFRPAIPEAGVREAAQNLAGRIAPFDLPPLVVADLDGFLALRESHSCPALQALADAAVEMLEPCRAPLTEAEVARRRPERLAERQRSHLYRWGYPHVFEDWRFHMTLSRRLTPGEADILRPAAEAALGTAAGRPRRVREVCLFAQAGPGEPFLILERFRLAG
ncbi:DUF1045 domain-containing protein [Pseudoroseomonas sp. WGS1072]|uniref:DUF1045 domain-containing protein n=1 Tax=Roseomonas sp. WGS1072 TaxID=3366816 RepID=UPI003BF17AEA